MGATTPKIGDRFGRWTYLGMAAPLAGARRWMVRCGGCGREFARLAKTILSGASTQCRSCAGKERIGRPEVAAAALAGGHARAARTAVPTPDEGQVFHGWRFVREIDRDPHSRARRCIAACVGCGRETVKPLAQVVGGYGPKRCRGCVDRRQVAAARARRAASMLPAPLAVGYMLRGQGDRRETCASYGACLNAARREAPQGAHCPRGCKHFRPVRLELETYGRSPIAAAQDHAVGFLGVSYGRVSKAA